MAVIACAIKSDLITLQEVEKILGISKSALYRLRQREDFPKGKYAYNKQRMHMPRVMFNKTEIEEWKNKSEDKNNI